MKITDKQFKEVREEMKRMNRKKHYTRQDINDILEAQETGDWSKVHAGTLYNKYGGEYCSMLEALNWLGL